MTTPLRQRLTWDGGAVHDGPRLYLLMRMIQDVAARPPKTFRPAG